MQPWHLLVNLTFFFLRSCPLHIKCDSSFASRSTTAGLSAPPISGHFTDTAVRQWESSIYEETRPISYGVVYTMPDGYIFAYADMASVREPVVAEVGNRFYMQGENAEDDNFVFCSKRVMKILNSLLSRRVYPYAKSR